MSIDEYAAAFARSDPAYDGRFVAAVRTTGIFCRPTCTARKPFPKNVTFLTDAAAARAAGYRPCLRCQPEAARRVTVREIDTPIGRMTLGVTDHALVLADFTRRRMMTAQLAAIRRRIGPIVVGDHPLLDDAEGELRDFLAGRRTTFDLPIEMPGSAFQESVWTALAGIPYGETISYAELARRVGVPAGSRAVGRANGSNRIAIVVPCHRVVGTGGGLGGYGGGLVAKQWLLTLEADVVASTANPWGPAAQA